MSTINKNTILVRGLGGNRMVHAVGCPWIADWTIDSCEPVDKLKPGKMKLCPTCKKMILTSQMAKDYQKHKRQYLKLYKEFNISDTVLESLCKQAKAKIELRNKVLYIHSKQDDWYIDFNYGDVHLYHNNYHVNERSNGINNAFAKGFHEHDLRCRELCDNPEAFAYEALRQIIKYDYKKADNVHKAKRREKKASRMVFSELDAEYWGFSS